MSLSFVIFMNFMAGLACLGLGLGRVVTKTQNILTPFLISMGILNLFIALFLFIK